MPFKVGDFLEVEGNPDEGFADSWQSVRLLGLPGKGKAYIESTVFEDDSGGRDRETVAISRLRPVPEDDSTTVDLDQRECGDAVDCLSNGVWWAGVVHETYNDKITVKFHDAVDSVYEVCPVEQNVIAPDEEEPRRVRTSKHYDASTRTWHLLQRQPAAKHSNHSSAKRQKTSSTGQRSVHEYKGREANHRMPKAPRSVFEDESDPEDDDDWEREQAMYLNKKGKAPPRAPAPPKADRSSSHRKEGKRDEAVSKPKARLSDVEPVSKGRSREETSKTGGKVGGGLVELDPCGGPPGDSKRADPWAILARKSMGEKSEGLGKPAEKAQDRARGEVGISKHLSSKRSDAEKGDAEKERHSKLQPASKAARREPHEPSEVRPSKPHTFSKASDAEKGARSKSQLPSKPEQKQLVEGDVFAATNGSAVPLSTILKAAEATSLPRFASRGTGEATAPKTAQGALISHAHADSDARQPTAHPQGAAELPRRSSLQAGEADKSGKFRRQETGRTRKSGEGPTEKRKSGESPMDKRKSGEGGGKAGAPTAKVPGADGAGKTAAAPKRRGSGDLEGGKDSKRRKVAAPEEPPPVTSPPAPTAPPAFTNFGDILSSWMAPPPNLSKSTSITLEESLPKPAAPKEPPRVESVPLSSDALHPLRGLGSAPQQPLSPEPLYSPQQPLTRQPLYSPSEPLTQEPMSPPQQPHFEEQPSLPWDVAPPPLPQEPPPLPWEGEAPPLPQEPYPPDSDPSQPPLPAEAAPFSGWQDSNWPGLATKFPAVERPRHDHHAEGFVPTGGGDYVYNQLASMPSSPMELELNMPAESAVANGPVDPRLVPRMPHPSTRTERESAASPVPATTPPSATVSQPPATAGPPPATASNPPATTSLSPATASQPLATSRTEPFVFSAQPPTEEHLQRKSGAPKDLQDVPLLKRKRSGAVAPEVHLVAEGTARQPKGRVEEALPDKHAGCRYLCLDNLGGGLERSQLHRGLMQAGIEGLSKVEVVSKPLPQAGISKAGWGYLCFIDHKAACQALPRLQQLYLVTDASPIPRPLVPHWRRRWHSDSSTGHEDVPILGHIQGLLVSPHFSQPNSSEFDAALSWRTARALEHDVREKLRAEHTCQLFTLMKAAEGLMKEHLPADQKHPPKQPVPLASPVLWLRKLSASCTKEMLVDAFQQWEGRVLGLVADPVSAGHTGQALVQLSSHETAVNVQKDISELVFVVGDSPRAVEASIAKPGKPQGSQAVYDRAMWQILHRDDSGPLTDPRFATIRAPATPKEVVAVQLRRQLEKQEMDRSKLAARILEREKQLADEIESLLDSEFRKAVQVVELQDKPQVSKVASFMNPKNHVRQLVLPPRFKDLMIPGCRLVGLGRAKSAPLTRGNSRGFNAPARGNSVNKGGGRVGAANGAPGGSGGFNMGHQRQDNGHRAPGRGMQCGNISQPRRYMRL